jgi:hypothetical protein
LAGFLAPPEGPPGGEAACAGDRREHSPASNLAARRGGVATPKRMASNRPAYEGRSSSQPGHGRKYRRAVNQRSRGWRPILAKSPSEWPPHWRL